MMLYQAHFRRFLHQYQWLDGDSGLGLGEGVGDSVHQFAFLFSRLIRFSLLIYFHTYLATSLGES